MLASPFFSFLSSRWWLFPWVACSVDCCCRALRSASQPFGSSPQSSPSQIRRSWPFEGSTSPAGRYHLWPRLDAKICDSISLRPQMGWVQLTVMELPLVASPSLTSMRAALKR